MLFILTQRIHVGGKKSKIPHKYDAYEDGLILQAWCITHSLIDISTQVKPAVYSKVYGRVAEYPKVMEMLTPF